jgi:hypothetical protein
MKPELLDPIHESLRRHPARLSRLHSLIRDAGSPWSAEQLRLFLETFDGYHLGGDDDDPEVSLGEMAPEEALLAAVRGILQAEAGRPMPLSRVIELLPAHFTTSPEQLRGLASKTADLEIRGPMIRLHS